MNFERKTLKVIKYLLNKQYQSDEYAPILTFVSLNHVLNTITSG